MPVDSPAPADPAPADPAPVTTAGRSAATLVAATVLVMLAFAANSVIARVALRTTDIDAATFTAVRLGSGAVVLWLVARLRRVAVTGSWGSAAALFVYAAAFSLAYLSLGTGTGALLLFGAVQVTMIGVGLARGERFGRVQVLGLAVALAGLVVLVAPGVSAPSPGPAALMLSAGVAWGVYSLRGRRSGEPVGASAGNFVRAVVPTLVLLALVPVTGHDLVPDAAGVGWALLSGAVTSGLGYVAWYAVLPSLRAVTASTVQLSVPVLAAVGGVLLLSEQVTVRLVVASVATLGGVAVVLRGR